MEQSPGGLLLRKRSWATQVVSSVAGGSPNHFFAVLTIISKFLEQPKPMHLTLHRCLIQVKHTSTPNMIEILRPEIQLKSQAAGLMGGFGGSGVGVGGSDELSAPLPVYAQKAGLTPKTIQEYIYK